ncbi:MAG: murE [Alphaproteobacteria bacterium]|nr:murE [Alphaproteobacteria bacterium]
MRLFDLMAQTAFSSSHTAQAQVPAAASRNIIIAGLASDSRVVRPGYLFAALPGVKASGDKYIEEAIQNGAVAILAQPGTKLPLSAGGVTLIEDPNPRRRFARMAAKFYGQQPETLIAVSGTNGKTSVASFCRQIWANLGHSAASIGTIGVEAPQLDWPQPATGYNLTTPDPVTLHQELSDLAKAGVTHAAVEASSHGLEQYRADGMVLKAAAFTNLTRDHLDYHGSMGAYFNAKARLFSEVLPAGSLAVINADMEYADRLEDICITFGHQVILYGAKGRDITLISQKPTETGQRLVINVFGKKYTVDMPVAGTFQAGNALCALGLTIGLEEDPKRFPLYIDALSKLTGVRGRLELVGHHPNGAAIYIDYAHTPDALETLLNALRPHTKNRLHVVFGCGGDRDPGKRPLMGGIAVKLADKVIVTDDNPRTENPKRIRQEILQASFGALEIADRRQAIETAILGLKSGDVLVIAGKGHEQGQIIDRVTHPFDDANEVRAALKRMAK